MSKQQSHFRMTVQRLSASDAEVLAYEAKIRAEIGNEGVRRFRELLAEDDTPVPAPSGDEQ